MWIAISAVAAAVLVAAAFAGLGKFGEMPQHPVNDRPKGHVPDGPVTPDLLAELRLPRALHGYRPTEVDRHLTQLADGTAEEPDRARFDVVRGGYDMQVVDALLARPRPASMTQTGTDLVDAE